MREKTTGSAIINGWIVSTSDEEDRAHPIYTIAYHDAATVTDFSTVRALKQRLRIDYTAEIQAAEEWPDLSERPRKIQKAYEDAAKSHISTPARQMQR